MTNFSLYYRIDCYNPKWPGKSKSRNHHFPRLEKLVTLQFLLAHLALPKWAYIIVIHDFIIIWDHDFGFVGLCVVCVCSSWPEYWLHELHILQVCNIMLSIDAHEIFSWYHLYFSTGSHFAQILKMALLSPSLNLEAQYCIWLWIQSGSTGSQGIIDLLYIGLKLQMF